MDYAPAKSTLPRRLTVFLLVVTMLFTLFSTILADEAFAASSSEYKVKQWTEDGTYYYYVYKGSLPKHYDDNPTFYTDPKDVFKSSNGMKITFYQAAGKATDEQVDAFWRYLGSQSKDYWYCGAYPFDVRVGGESFRYWYVYKIEGWDYKGNVANLVKASPFTNSDNVFLLTPSIRAVSVTVKPRGFITSSRNTVPGCVGFLLIIYISPSFD